MNSIRFLRPPPFHSPPPPVFPIFPKPLIRNGHHNQPIFCSKTQTSTSTYSPSSLHDDPQGPLFLRPLIHTSTLTDLQTFIRRAKSVVSSTGSTFVQLDNGPDSSLLLRELRWLLQDSVDDPSLIPHLDNITENGSSLVGVPRPRPREIIRLRASLEQLYELWKQRIEERRPFQYIVGCEHWRDLVLRVEEGVLIPRPESEKIVELVRDVVSVSEMLRQGLWGDLGTGSGALAIGIARTLGVNGRVVATDLSPTAIAVARFNVERYGLQDVVEIVQGSWFDPLLHLEGELVGLVSNPPYIPSEDISGLQAEVREHEPRLALDGGVEGMDCLLRLCEKAATMLKPGGFFVFETNGGKQCKSLVNYLENQMATSFRDVNIVPDFADIPRFLTGFRN
ncbi:hypothetical protein Dimus_019627 [Dionaea muscipula]